MIPKPNMGNIAAAEDKTTAAVTEMLKGPMWMIEQILRKHETAVIEVMREQQEKIERLIKVSEDIAYHNQQLRDAIERMRVAGDKFEFQCRLS